MMVVCQFCGKENNGPPDAQYCTYCGSSLASSQRLSTPAPSYPPATQPGPMPTSQPSSTGASPRSYGYGASYGVSERYERALSSVEKLGTVVLVLAVVVIILVL